ncbi:MAG TPA: class I SAM-dependent methyltransferase [Acidimicrobiales bacterium]|nr:class I SAM-dependent methyltransferase [Acidimicrobiales bacterium]
MERRRWDERYAEPDRKPLREPNALVVEELSSTTPGTALELAAGEGRHARWLASRGWRVVAADFSETALRRAKHEANAEGLDIHFVVADVHTLPLPPAAFDLVLATFFHPRPSERPALYPTLVRALRPGGTLLLVSYDKANLAEGNKGPQDPDFLMDPPILAAELRDLGLDVTRAETVRTPEAVNAVIRAVKPA